VAEAVSAVAEAAQAAEIAVASTIENRDTEPIRREIIMAKLRIKWVRSAIGHPKDQKATIQALKLRKLQQTVEHEDNPAIRGMVRKVSHLVEVEEIQQ
jgi:large subunit ribosomal protein L30